METVLEHLHISEELFQWFILPIVIFLARIGDVSIGTIRILLMINDRKYLATFLGFCESLIWLTVITSIFKYVKTPIAYVAYAAGYATGTYVGMIIENRLAVGKVTVRFITRQDATALLNHLRAHGFGFTTVKAQGHKGEVNMIFSVVNRKDLKGLIQLVQSYHPNAFYSIEATKYASELPDNNGEIVTKKWFWRNILSRDFFKKV